MAILQPVKQLKIKTNVTTKNFRKFKQKVLNGPVVAVVSTKRKIQTPKRTSQRIPSRPIPSRVQPAHVKLRKPAAPPVVKKKEPPPPLKKPARIRQELPKPPVAAKPARSLLQQNLSNLRKQALARGKSKQRTAIRQKNLNIVMGRVGKGVRAQTSNKNILTIKNAGVGRILIMVGAGQSVNEVDLTPLNHQSKIDFMCINKPFDSIWPSKYWAFCDHTQQRANPEKWNKFTGIIINSPNVKARRPNQIIIKSKPGKGFSLDITKGYHIGRSSTYANMQAAAYMSYKKVYLFGIDMAEVGGKLHHYGQNPDVSNDNRKKRFPIEASHFYWAGQNLAKEIRERFVFCSSYNTWDFLKYFEKMDHKEAVQKILKYAESKCG